MTLAAQTTAAREGTRKAAEEESVPQDAMAAAERQAGAAKGPAFVAAKSTAVRNEEDGDDEGGAQTAAQAQNADEIQISDDEL